MTKTTNNKGTKMLTVNIPANMFDKFKHECKEDNLTMSEAIKGFIQSYLDGNLEAMATGVIGDNTTAKQIEEAVERKIDDYISNEIDQVVTRHLETDLDVKLDSVLEKKLDKYLDDKLESRLKAKLDTCLDNDTETNLDEKLEPQPQETMGDDTDTNLDSNLETTTATAKKDETPASEEKSGGIETQQQDGEAAILQESDHSESPAIDEAEESAIASGKWRSHIAQTLPDNLSYPKLAEAYGISRNTLANWVNGSTIPRGKAKDGRDKKVVWDEIKANWELGEDGQWHKR